MSSPTPNGSAEANQTVSETDAQEQGKSENQEEIIENTTADQRLFQRNVNKGRVEGFAASIDSLSQYHVLVLSEIVQTVQSDIERLNEITTQLENSIAEIHNFVRTKLSTNLQRILEGIIGILSKIISVTNVVWFNNAGS